MEKKTPIDTHASSTSQAHESQPETVSQTLEAGSVSRLDPTNPLNRRTMMRLQRTLGNQAVAKLLMSQQQSATAPETASTSNNTSARPPLIHQQAPPIAVDRLIQREWQDTDEDTIKKWNAPITGLLWYYNSVTKKLHYEVADISLIPEKQRAEISNAAGKGYLYQEWKDAGWSGEVEAAKPEVVEAEAEAPAVAKKSTFKGAFRVFEFSNPLQYLESDPEFDEIYDESTGGDEIIIGVLDTGILAASSYLKGHMKAAGDFTAKPKSKEEYAQDIQDYHGTKVAGQAAFGSDRIKLIDVRVQTGQISGDDNNDNIAEGIKWAISQGARVITCSVDLNWAADPIQTVVGANPEVLFLTSAGNNATEMTERKIDKGGEERENALLVGGATLDKRKHPSRGFGDKAVDIMVPSGSSNDSDRALSVSFPKSASAQDMIKGIEQQKAKELTRLNQDKSDLQNELAKETPNKNTVLRYQKFVTQGEEKISKFNLQIANLKKIVDESTETDLGSESGVSFGIPVIANIAAKMLLINPGLKIAEIKDILTNIAVDKSSDELSTTSKSGGMVDPVKAYQEASARIK